MNSKRTGVTSLLIGEAIFLAALCLPLVSPLVAVAGSPCPTNNLYVTAYFTDDSLHTADGSNTLSIENSSGRADTFYDLGTGSFQIAGERFSKATISATDFYTVTGIPPGTVLNLKAILSIRASLFKTGDNSGAVVLWELIDGSGNYVYSYKGAPADIDSSLSLDLTVVSGLEFSLTIILLGDSHFGAGYQANTTNHPGATLTFGDLPKGARISSCQGFEQLEPTPVISSTWGRLKALMLPRSPTFFTQ